MQKSRKQMNAVFLPAYGKRRNFRKALKKKKSGIKKKEWTRIFLLRAFSSPGLKTGEIFICFKTQNNWKTIDNSKG